MLGPAGLLPGDQRLRKEQARNLNASPVLGAAAGSISCTKPRQRLAVIQYVSSSRRYALDVLDLERWGFRALVA